MFKQEWKHFLGLFFFYSLLTACASLQPSSLTGKTGSAAHLHQWTLQGVVSLQYAESSSLTHLEWHQAGPKTYHMNLWGPLGLGRVEMIGNPNSVLLTQSGQPPMRANRPEILMQQYLGWYLPVSYLYYWIRALPVPGLKYKQNLDTDGHLSLLNQAGWEVNYLSYHEVEGMLLPQKISFSNENLKVKLVIKNMTLQ